MEETPTTGGNEQPDQPDQAPQAPEPPPPPAPAPAPPKKSNKKWWFIGCGCLLIACILVVSAAALFTGLIGGGVFSLYKAISEPVKPIKAQLDAVNSGDVEKAYNDYTTQAFKNATSLDQFKQMVDQNPAIFKSKSSSFTNVNIKNGVATITGTITGQDGTVTAMEYTCVNEGGEWKIQSFKEK